MEVRVPLARTVNVTLLLGGLFLLAFLIYHLDFQLVLERLGLVGWCFPLAFLAYLASMALSTLGWYWLIDPARSRVSFPRLLGIFWAGHAINQLTPGGTLGEVLKGSLSRDAMEGEEIVTSLVVDNYLNLVTTQLLVLLGPVVCLVLSPLPRPIVWAMLAVSLVFCLPLFCYRYFMRRSASESLLRLSGKIRFLRVRTPESWLEKARIIDRRLRDYRARLGSRFFGVVAALLLVRAMQVLETFLLLWPMLGEQGWRQVLLISFLTQSAGQLISWAAAFVPGQIGVLEGGIASLYHLLGLDPITGLSLELMRRLRKIIGISIGLIVGALDGGRRKLDPRPREDCA